MGSRDLLSGSLRHLRSRCSFVSKIVRNMRLLEELLGILQSTFGQALESEPTTLKPINPWQLRKKCKGLMHSVKVLDVKYCSARCSELKCSGPQFCCEHIVQLLAAGC